MAWVVIKHLSLGLLQLASGPDIALGLTELVITRPMMRLPIVLNFLSIGIEGIHWNSRVSGLLMFRVLN
jgi:hypothetical protein